MIAATAELLAIVVLGVLAIHLLGTWARSAPVASRSPKVDFQRQVPARHSLGKPAQTTR
ncbi:hypothetical protein D9M68_874490 [compost metagenome]